MNWKVDENKELPVAVIEDTEDGFGICELDGGGTASRDELEKTARLIAAAPYLLDTCEMMLRLMEGENLDEKFDGETEILRDAVKRAK